MHYAVRTYPYLYKYIAQILRGHNNSKIQTQEIKYGHFNKYIFSTGFEDSRMSTYALRMHVTRCEHCNSFFELIIQDCYYRDMKHADPDLAQKVIFNVMVADI